MLILPAAGQSTISPLGKFAYAANGGWIDLWNSGSSGVRIAEGVLSGKAYAANIGWIDFGSGSPANGFRYSNSSGSDWGVNLETDGKLSGYAYAGNVGWINFEQTHGKAKLDYLTGQLSGSAYSGNIGWIELDTAFTDLITLTIDRPDLDGDGIADAWEMQHFGNLTLGTSSSDADGDGVSDAGEYQSGTDPNAADSRFRILSHAIDVESSVAVITFNGQPGRLYRIEHTRDPGGIWSNSTLGTFTPDAGGFTSKAISFPTDTRRFFRAASILPLQP